MISALQARKLLLNRCSGFLTTLVETKTEGPTLDVIPVVKEFPDVFLKIFRDYHQTEKWNLHKGLGTKLTFSTAFQPQTDGQ